MCMYFSAESIMLNLLCYYQKVAEGIDLNLIQEYCLMLKKELYDNMRYQGLVFFESSEPYINEFTNRNRDSISTVLEKYYRNCGFDGEQLIKQVCLNEETTKMMKLVAEHLDE